MDSYNIRSQQKFLNDISWSTVSSGAIACLVGYLSSAALVFQLAKQLGLNSVEASQWIGVLCVAMGIITIALSWRYRTPLMFAWSTPGIAVLIAGMHEFSVERAIGVFIAAAVMTIVTGMSGQFDQLMKWIPGEVSAALIAGILLKFCLNAFSAIVDLPLVISIMLLCYVIMRKVYSFAAVPVSLFFGLIVLTATKGIAVENIDFHIYLPKVWMPEFQFSDIIGLALPMFIVTMTSQNVTGFAVIRSNGYKASGSMLLTWAGIAHLLVAPLGGFCLNLSSLTAAIIAGPDAHPDKSRRYTGAVSSGVIYIVMGFFASAFAGLLGVIPSAMVTSIGGLALISVVAVNLEKSFHSDKWKEAALFTFLVAASNFTFLGIGSAFWALVIGMTVHLIRMLVDHLRLKI